jgi:hypothetical protein
MPEQPPTLRRADLPAKFTPDTVQEPLIATLRRLADHRSEILARDEQQRAFDS